MDYMRAPQFNRGCHVRPAALPFNAFASGIALNRINAKPLLGTAFFGPCFCGLYGFMIRAHEVYLHQRRSQSSCARPKRRLPLIRFSGSFGTCLSTRDHGAGFSLSPCFVTAVETFVVTAKLLRGMNSGTRQECRTMKLAGAKINAKADMHSAQTHTKAPKNIAEFDRDSK
jgi:hypothetical protein